MQTHEALEKIAATAASSLKSLAVSAPSFATQRRHDRRGESRGMARVRRSYEVTINDDRRILHPGCTGSFSVGLHDQFGVRRAVIEARHAAASNNLRAEIGRASCRERV